MLIQLNYQSTLADLDRMLAQAAGLPGVRDLQCEPGGPLLAMQNCPAASEALAEWRQMQISKILETWPLPMPQNLRELRRMLMIAYQEGQRAGVQARIVAVDRAEFLKAEADKTAKPPEKKRRR